TGRAPLEAAAQGIELGAEDWAIRCNLVTIEDQTMKSFTAGQITSEEARELLAALQESTEDTRLEFVPGVSYRNLLIFRPGDGEAPFTRDTTATPPHDLTDKTVRDDFPRGPGSDLLNRLMAQSVEVFGEHPVNQKRVAEGKPPATNVWLWGIGKRPALTSFQDRFGRQGAMITAVDLLRGLAALIGWERIEVPGATGYTDTDYAAKGRYAIDTLSGTDVVCVHVEAPDEASHEGDIPAKIKALEEIDAKIVGPLLDHFEASGDDFRILVMPDHPTPVRTKTHSHGDVPFVICGTGIETDEATTYGETSAAASTLAFPEGWKLMNYFLGVEETS
ncbi:MAG: cofactor-independent phosphoglycerate mutase, partial [Pirellulales bacterium]|nr:cofactor-independent phosphoglycerate mutase [Pirellulales bacterium]